MIDPLNELLNELEDFGKINDVFALHRSYQMLNVTRNTGALLAVLVKSISAKNILEIGTSNGYSTIWLAMAASKVGGLVQTIECSEYKISLAKTNFEKSGLMPFIEQIHDDAGHALGKLIDKQYDFVFLDAERTQYIQWWPSIRQIIRPGGLLVIDNAVSHAKEMQPFLSIVSRDKDFTTRLIPLGHGAFLASKFAPIKIGSLICGPTPACSGQ
jgi:predicted O-methyltransferase YrrM